MRMILNIIIVRIFEIGFASRVFEFSPISTASPHPMHSSEQAANRAFDYPVMVPELKASEAQEFGSTFFDAPRILFHCLLLVVKSSFRSKLYSGVWHFRWLSWRRCLKNFFDVLFQAIFWISCMSMLCHFVRGGLCG